MFWYHALARTLSHVVGKPHPRLWGVSKVVHLVDDDWTAQLGLMVRLVVWCGEPLFVGIRSSCYGNDSVLAY